MLTGSVSACGCCGHWSTLSGAHVMAAERIHADDTTVPVLAPGNGKTKTGRIWCYVRDDHPFAGQAPKAVLYC